MQLRLPRLNRTKRYNDPYSDGSLPTQVSIGLSNSVVDSEGNVYIAAGTAIYLVYGGGNIPQTLKNINDSPKAGRI